jgi:hypothetical protein
VFARLRASHGLNGSYACGRARNDAGQKSTSRKFHQIGTGNALVGRDDQDSGQFVNNLYLRIVSGLPVIQAQTPRCQAWAERE